MLPRPTSGSFEFMQVRLERERERRRRTGSGFYSKINIDETQPESIQYTSTNIVLDGEDSSFPTKPRCRQTYPAPKISSPPSPNTPRLSSPSPSPLSVSSTIPSTISPSSAPVLTNQVLMTQLTAATSPSSSLNSTPASSPNKSSPSSPLSPLSPQTASPQSPSPKISSPPLSNAQSFTSPPPTHHIKSNLVLTNIKLSTPTSTQSAPTTPIAPTTPTVSSLSPSTSSLPPFPFPFARQKTVARALPSSNRPRSYARIIGKEETAVQRAELNNF